MSTSELTASAFGRLKVWLKGHAVRRLRSRYGIGDDAVRNVSSLWKLSGAKEGGGFPTELLGLGASMWSGFIITPFASQQMEGWVLPYWLRMQSDPASPSFVPHSHAFLKPNMTHRNWTGVGIPGYPNEGSVDPRGLVTPWPFAPSVDTWLLAGGSLVAPSRLDTVEQRLVDSIPVVETTFEAHGLSARLTSFVSPLDTLPVQVTVARVENTTEGPLEAGLAFSLRPYNTESVRAVNAIEYDPGRRLFRADGVELFYLPQVPDEVLLSDYLHGDVALLLEQPARERPPEGSSSIEEPLGLGTAAAVYRFSLGPGEVAERCFLCPLMEGIHPRFGAMLAGGEPAAAARTAEQKELARWAEALDECTRATIPQESYQKAFDTGKTFLLLMYDGAAITPGISTYHMMWFRDAAYLVPALERMGHSDYARRILRTYPDRQKADGFFRSHNGEWDSNGQAMWTLANHFYMTGDRAFLSEVFPSMVKGAEWLESMRVIDLPAGDPSCGLLPPGISAEHFGISDTFYFDDLWAVGGLRAAAACARTLGRGEDARRMDALASEYWRSLEASWEKATARLGREVLPIAPSRDVDAASVGMMAAVYPLDLMSPDDPRIVNTARELKEKSSFRDTHYHGMMHCGVNPYLSMHLAQYYLRRRDPYAHVIFESLWSMATSTCTFPEAINPLTMGGAYGDGHDGWSAGDIFHFVRNLLVSEEGDTLCLLPLPRTEWLEPGRSVELVRAPTYFGEVTCHATGGDDLVSFELECTWREPPRELLLGVPFAPGSCEVDGRSVEVGRDTGAVRVGGDSRSVTVRRG